MQTRLTLRPGQRGTKRLTRRCQGSGKAAGGRWNREWRVWELPYGAVRALDLDDRIVTSHAS